MNIMILPSFVYIGPIVEQKGVVPTISPSMDIQISSNFERFIFDILEKDAKTVKNDFGDYPFDWLRDLMSL